MLPLHIAPRPDLIGSADIAADALTAAVTAFLDHIITEAVCCRHTLCVQLREFVHTLCAIKHFKKTIKIRNAIHNI